MPDQVAPSEPKRKKHPGGRPRKLADKLPREKIYAILSIGGSRTDAAKSLGVSMVTMQSEAKRDPEFLRGMEKAEAQGKLELLRKIKGAAPWQAAAWMLERKYPQEFARMDRHEHTGSGGGPIDNKLIITVVDTSDGK